MASSVELVSQAPKWSLRSKMCAMAAVSVTVTGVALSILFGVQHDWAAMAGAGLGNIAGGALLGRLTLHSRECDRTLPTPEVESYFDWDDSDDDKDPVRAARE